ncbi:MAG: hypothetical protein AAGI25_13935 [Bacteroidota bacterium]
MVRIRLAEWPMVRIDVDGLITLPEIEEYIAAMEKFLEETERREEPYGMIYNTQMTDKEFKSTKREKDAHKRSVQWTREAKPRICAYCIGIATIAQGSAMMKFMKPIIKMGMKKMMGAPGEAFFSVDEGKKWLQSRLNSQ